MGIKSNGIATVWDNTRKQPRMGIITNIKVVQLALGLCLLLVPESSSSLCPHRRQYWHEEREKCVNCTTCQAGEIVIRPCQIHRDAQCGPISELNIDWSFLTRREHKHHLDLEKTSHHKHQKHAHPERHDDGYKHQGKHKHHHKSFQEKQEEKLLQHELSELNSKVKEYQGAHQTAGPENLEVSPTYLGTTREGSSGKVSQLPESAALHHHQTSTVVSLAEEPPTRPFSAFERVVWDWQVVVLVLAVFACILFFLVTGIYTIHHIRQWRRFKHGYKPDVEEVYARRSLMLPGHMDFQAAPPSMESYALQQSLCMEQLLVLKTQEELGASKGNFYIVRDKASEIQEESQ